MSRDTVKCCRCGRTFAAYELPPPALCPPCRGEAARNGLPIHPGWWAPHVVAICKEHTR